MVHLPREVRDQLFDKFLARGEVLRVGNYPKLQTGPKDKFIILLNHRFVPDKAIYHVLTTSQVEKIKVFPWFRRYAVVVPRGTATFFPLDTAIVCREVQNLSYEVLKGRYADGTIQFVGKLPAMAMEQIDGILKISPYVSPEIQEQIF